jgi:hypothetical protein
LEVDGTARSSTGGPAVSARAHRDLGLSLCKLFRFGVTELWHHPDPGPYSRGRRLPVQPLVPNAGPCIDFHRAARAFQLEQLAFALEAVLQAGRPADVAAVPA